MRNNVLEYKIEELRHLVNLYPWFSWVREELLYKVVDINPEYLDVFYSDNLFFFPKKELVLFKAKGIVVKKRDLKYSEDKIFVDYDKTIKKLVEERPNSDDYDEKIIIVNEEAVNKEDFAVDFKNFEKEKILSAENDKKEEECYYTTNNNDKEEIVFERESFDRKIVVVGGDYFSQEDFNILGEKEKVKEIKITPFNDKDDNIKDPVKDLDTLVDYDLPEFYTETLAKIYAEQELYKEAIDVYAKLILLYPEKSAYFASLVKEIKLKN